jgi:SAM-dependent methyltransferase
MLAAGMRALDLGAGSGQATRILVDAGMDVTAVESGPALAAALRDRLPGVRVVEATAEAAELPPASFDVATIATAVHWFDLEVVLPKLHRTLVPGGRLAVWRNAYGDAAVPLTPFRERIGAIVARRDAAPRHPGCPRPRRNGHRALPHAAHRARPRRLNPSFGPAALTHVSIPRPSVRRLGRR